MNSNKFVAHLIVYRNLGWEDELIYNVYNEKFNQIYDKEGEKVVRRGVYRK